MKCVKYWLFWEKWGVNSSQFIAESSNADSIPEFVIGLPVKQVSNISPDTNLPAMTQ